MATKTTRRELFKMMGGAPLLAATTGLTGQRSMRPGPGPRLFFGEKDLPRIRKAFAEDARFARLRIELRDRDRAADRVFLRGEINFNDQLKNLARVGMCAQDMAWWYLMTGDEEAAELAIEGARTLMKFPAWDFFADEHRRVVGVQRAPSSTIALACAIDWLGDRVEAQERAEWLEAIGKRGCEPCFRGLESIRHPRQNWGWDFNPDSAVYEERKDFPTDLARRAEITQDTNLRAVPAGGLAVGAAILALHGDPTGQVDRWLEMAVFSIKAFERIYLPDGSYGEGVHYANYTSESILIGLEALRKSGLYHLEVDIDWVGHIRYMLHLSMATTGNPYEVVNIGDNGMHRDPDRSRYPQGIPEARTGISYWTAREFRDGGAQWFGQNLAAAHDIWSLIFCDDSVEPVAPEEGPQTWYSDLDWIVARTGFKADDLVVSLRSGIGFNHEHADRNSIIVKCFGEQLIVDPIRPPYWFRDPSWILRETAGHSAVLIDGAGHLHNNGVEGTNATICQARIVDRGGADGYSFWTSDATQAYRVANAEIRSVVRSVVVFFDQPAVVIVDRISKWRNESEFEARFFADNDDGRAKLSTRTDGFTIQRAGAYAESQVFCRGGIEVSAEQLPIPAERAVKHPFVKVKTGAGMATTIVTAVALGGPGKPAVAVTIRSVSDDLIEVSMGGTGQRAICRINDAGQVPVITAKTG